MKGRRRSRWPISNRTVVSLLVLELLLLELLLLELELLLLLWLPSVGGGVVSRRGLLLLTIRRLATEGRSGSTPLLMAYTKL